MRSAIRITLACAFVASMALTASAALSQKYADFGNGPATFLMTPEEQAKWKTIANDADAQAFIDLFWARRDPTPTTPANEFRDQFDARVAYADSHFNGFRKVGSMTELGRVLILLGPPTRAAHTAPDTSRRPAHVPGTDVLAGGNPSDAVSDTAGRYTFTYERAKGAPAFLPPVMDVGFTDQFGNGSWRISTDKYDVNSFLKKASELAIVNPGLTEAPKYGQVTRTTTTTSSVTVTKPAAPALPPLATAALQAAVAAQKGGTSTINKNAHLVFAELVSPAGDYFTPIGVFIPKSAGVAPEAIDTIFGVIEDANGTAVTSFEKPVTAFSSKGDVLSDVTIDVPAGKYNAIVGVAKAGQPVAIASKSIEVTPLAKDATGVSRMILTNNLDAELAEAAPVKSPFAFGKVKLVPRGDAIFSNKDELGYFIELHNPGIDATTNAPKVQVKEELSGGKLKAAIAAPLREIPALPLAGTGAGGPGQYAIISGIPLSAMSTPLAKGDYTLKVKLIDMVTKQSYTVDQSFKIE